MYPSLLRDPTRQANSGCSPKNWCIVRKFRDLSGFKVFFQKKTSQSWDHSIGGKGVQHGGKGVQHGGAPPSPISNCWPSATNVAEPNSKNYTSNFCSNQPTFPTIYDNRLTITTDSTLLPPDGTYLYGQHLQQSMDQPGMVANPACGRFNKDVCCCPRLRLRIWSRETCSTVPYRPVPYRPA